MRAILTFVLAILLCGVVCRAAEPIDPAKATLGEAIEDWVKLIEANDAKTAAERWTAGEKAAGELNELWQQQCAAHKKHDYRKWIEQAGKIGDETKFKVGGHSVGHIHVDWIRTRSGWRIEHVWMCR